MSSDLFPINNIVNCSMVKRIRPALMPTISYRSFSGSNRSIFTNSCLNLCLWVGLGAVGVPGEPGDGDVGSRALMVAHGLCELSNLEFWMADLLCWVLLLRTFADCCCWRPFLCFALLCSGLSSKFSRPSDLFNHSNTLSTLPILFPSSCLRKTRLRNMSFNPKQAQYHSILDLLRLYCCQCLVCFYCFFVA